MTMPAVTNCNAKAMRSGMGAPKKLIDDMRRPNGALCPGVPGAPPVGMPPGAAPPKR